MTVPLSRRVSLRRPLGMTFLGTLKLGGNSSQLVRVFSLVRMLTFLGTFKLGGNSSQLVRVFSLVRILTFLGTFKLGGNSLQLECVLPL